MPKIQNLLTLILSVFLFSLTNQIVFAETQVQNSFTTNSTNIDKLKTSIFTISSVDKKSCGTAFLASDNTLFTANHVIELILKRQNINLVPTKNNESFSILLKDAFNTEKTLKISAQHISQIPSLDIAKINLEETPATQSFNTPNNNNPYKVGNPIFSIGFKNCNEIIVIKGTIKKDSEIWLETDLKGYFGMSGSPVFSANGEFIGLIDQAQSILGGLSGRIFGSSFSLRVTKASSLKLLENNNSELLSIILSLKDEVSLINKNYLENLIGLNSYTRLIKSLEFFSQKKLFLQRLSNYPQINPILTPLIRNETRVNLESIIEFTNVLVDKPNLIEQITNELNEQISLLSIYNAYETYGSFNGANFSNNNFAIYKNKIAESTLSPNLKETLLNFIENTKKQSYPGYEAMILSSCFLVVCLFFIVALWILTLGYVLGDYKKGFWSKLWVTFVIGFLLWPLSFLVYLKFVKKNSS